MPCATESVEKVLMAPSDWMAAIALVVSISHAGASSYAWWRDRKNLILTATWRYWNTQHEECPGDHFMKRAPMLTIVNRSTTPVTIENVTTGAYEDGKPRRGFIWGIGTRKFRYVGADIEVELPKVLGPGEMIRLDISAKKEFVSNRDKWRFGFAVTHSLSDKDAKVLLPR